MDTEIDQVMGYEAGADDYITKPFSLSVLVLKVNAFFKRYQKSPADELESGDLLVFHVPDECPKRTGGYFLYEKMSGRC